MNPTLVPARVTVTVEIDGETKTQCIYIQQVPIDQYAADGRNSTVRQMIRVAAESTARAFPATASPYSDDLFVKAGYEPKRSCCAPKPEDDPTDGGLTGRTEY